MVDADPPPEEILAGGVANLGAVVRVGDTVRRPLAANHATMQAFLRHLHDVGFEGVPEPLGIDEHGREILRFIPGEVPIPPFPAWSLTDESLASVARLQRRYHEAGATFRPPPDALWSDELTDPLDGGVICHNDVCRENVVFRHGEAVALLDFDFAAPGRDVWDLAATCRMWIPLGDPAFAAPGLAGLDQFHRLRLLADAYGLAVEDRPALVDAIMYKLGFVRRHVEAGEPAFIEMWLAGGGEARDLANDVWYESQRDAMLRALD